ncbi:MAG: hypothetical protein ACC707_03580 [Thiohalomonadales bacterium]
MANISIRKIDDGVYERLRIRAASHGLSIEEEVRQILNLTVNAPEKLGDLALEYFGENNGVDLVLPLHYSHEPLKFGE